MSDQIIKFAAVGDIALTHGYDKLLATEGPHYPFHHVRNIFQEYDIVFGNLEAPLSRRGAIFPLKCSLRSDPRYAEGLKNAGFNIISLANNHILDYGDIAFSDTFKYLKRFDINYFGAGKNLKESREPAILEIKGVKIGFLGYCDVVIDSPFYASDNIRGIAPLKQSYIREDITRLKKSVDVTIVSLHWGIENWYYPSPNQINIAHKIIDFGADLILGHHPHVLQGIEKYKNAYIAYSLGNFIFSDIHWFWINEAGKKIFSAVRLNDRNRESTILTVSLTKSGVQQVGSTPGLISKNLQPVVTDNELLKDKINKLSKKYYMPNYERFWRRYCLVQKYKTMLLYIIRRLKNIHRLRPAHAKEFLNMVRFGSKRV